MQGIYNKRLVNLSESQQKILMEVITAFESKVESHITKQSDICTPKFSEDFQNRLVLYHAMNEEVLNKKTFEYAFVGACKFDGRQARLESNPVNPGTDAVVNGVAYSLKTEASRGINPSNITISKLMEARWIRECETGEDFLSGMKQLLFGQSTFGSQKT